MWSRTMGTGTILTQRTRSENRKTRSASTAKDGEISSPLEVIHGNHLTPASGRQYMQTRNSSTKDMSSEKENAPPLPTKALVSKRAVDSTVPKARKKRKDSGAAPSHPKLCEDDKETETVVSGVRAGHSAHLSPDRRAITLARSVPVNGTGFETRSNNAYGPADSGIDDLRANLGTDGEREASVGCQVSNRYKIPTALGVSSRPDNKGKSALLISEFDQKVETAIPNTSPFLLLQKDYDKVYTKYQKLKAHRFAEIDARFENQNSRITAYVNATEALVEHYKGENCHLRQQLQESNIAEFFTRYKFLEKTNVECRNDLVLEQSKSLELRQEIKRLKSLLSKDTVGRSNSTELGLNLSLQQSPRFVVDIRNRKSLSGLPPEAKTKLTMSLVVAAEEGGAGLSSRSKLMHQLLEYLVGLKLSFSAEGVAEFQHCQTGFKFSLRTVHDMDIAQLVGGGELVYQNVSLGTLCKKATGWMKEEEAIFGVAQAQLLFKTLRRFLQQGA